MPNAHGRSIDNTHMSADKAEERQIRHRDLYAHMFRWAHIARYLSSNHRYKDARILDIGCGVDVPLAKMLYSNRYIPQEYIGVDYNKSSKLNIEMFEKGRFPIDVYGKVDFADINCVNINSNGYKEKELDLSFHVNGDKFEGYHELPNLFTCLEMLEHVEPSHTRRTLIKINDLMKESHIHWGEHPIAFISTPCWDPSVGAADNHVNEMKREALGALLEDLGFEIEGNYGTFASQRDYRDNMLRERPELKRLWTELHSYYDSNTLAIMFAPIFPQYARNNLWVLRLSGYSKSYERKFIGLKDLPGPWTSSDNWKELNEDS